MWQAYRDKEERLVATAFYDLGMKLNRGSVEGRLANLSQVYTERIEWGYGTGRFCARWLLYVDPQLGSTVTYTCPRTSSSLLRLKHIH